MSETLPPVLGEATVQELRDALRGELLQPGDEQYDEAKRLWNGAHDGSEPAMVARCTGAADVIARSASPGPTISRSRCGAAATAWPGSRRATGEW